jgi:hypothetical protein
MPIEISTNPHSKSKSFPKIMCSKMNGAIVLFEEDGKGIALNGPDPGLYSTAWNMDFFIDYDGTVTLKNTNY